ncbi:energy transducer TonB [Algoriphagus mannitolivorans]|uniref:energy transducer TonB n=1 Tax=Algoriphagus mannitolivorans TaxID=226504 RepID=UPI00042331D2|nr:energy transducer TonB [Algoriphagus mannitolivorans]
MKTQHIQRITFAFFALLSLQLLAFEAKAQETVHKKVDEMPVPPGGMPGFTQYMIDNLKYPETAKEKGIEGLVLVAFVVKSDGSVENIEIIRGIGAGCDEEAKRIVAESGKWTPGRLDGESVNTQMTLPIKFKL